MPTVNSICLIAAQRTGSNMLMSMFPAEQFVDLGEVFNLNNFRTSGFEQQGEDLDVLRQKAREDRSDFLTNYVHRPDLYGGRIPVWKYQYGNFARAESEPWQENLIQTVKGLERVGFIHLTRRDLVARHVSLQKAKQTGRYHLREGATPTEDQGKLTIHPGHCLKDIRRISDLGEMADRLFGASGKYMNVVYEDIIADPEAEARRISQAFDLDFDLQRPKTQRQGKPLAETVENYRDLRKRLKDTPWAEFVPPLPAGPKAAAAEQPVPDSGQAVGAD